MARPLRTFVLRNGDIRETCLAFIASLDLGGKPFEIIVRYLSKGRTIEQNKRYWAIIRDVAEQWWPNGIQYSEEEWHESFKTKFIGSHELTDPLTGQSKLIGLSTTTLDTQEFSDYCTEIEAYATTVGSVIFTDPSPVQDYYREAA